MNLLDLDYNVNNIIKKIDSLQSEINEIKRTALFDISKFTSFKSEANALEDIITINGGNVGIGVSSPSTKQLTVAGPNSASSVIRNQFSDDAIPQMRSDWYTTINRTYLNSYSDSGAVYKPMMLRANIMEIMTGDTTSYYGIYINQIGHVGIGSITETGALLTVNGGFAVDGLFPNSITANMSVDADSEELAINYNGYLGGVTRFRDFIIYNGKRSKLLTVDGSAGSIFSDDWTDISATSTIVGWSSFTIKTLCYMRLGKLLFVQFRLYGTSDNATTTFTLPSSLTNNSLIVVNQLIDTRDAGGAYQAGLLEIPVSSNVVSLYKDLTGNAFTNSGTKFVSGQFFVKVA